MTSRSRSLVTVAENETGFPGPAALVVSSCIPSLVEIKKFQVAVGVGVVQLDALDDRGAGVDDRAPVGRVAVLAFGRFVVAAVGQRVGARRAAVAEDAGELVGTAALIGHAGQRVHDGLGEATQAQQQGQHKQASH